MSLTQGYLVPSFGGRSVRASLLLSVLVLATVLGPIPFQTSFAQERNVSMIKSASPSTIVKGRVVSEPLCEVNAWCSFDLYVTHVLQTPGPDCQLYPGNTVRIETNSSISCLDRPIHQGDEVEAAGESRCQPPSLDVVSCEDGHYIRKTTLGGLPDLSFRSTGFDRPEPLNDGDMIHFGATIVSPGEGEAHNFRIEVYLDDSLFESRKLSLGADQSEQLWTTNSWVATEGTHNATWIADTTNLIVESNETNNRISRSFVVRPPPFICTCSVNPSSLAIVQGETASFQVTVERIKGPSKTVALNLSGLPKGSSHSFVPAGGTPAPILTSTLMITTSPSMPVRTFNLTVAAKTETGETCKTALSLVVNEQPFEFSVAASPSSQSALQGDKASYQVTITRKSTTKREVNLSIMGLGTGLKASFNPISCTPDCKSTMTIATTKDTPPGSYVITITGKDGGSTYSTRVTLTVQASLSLQVLVFPQEVAAPISGSGEYPLGRTVVLDAPAQVGDMYLVGWWVDGVPKSAMSPRFQVTMDESHAVAAVYAKSSVYETMLRSIKGQLADNIGEIAKTVVLKAKQLGPDEQVINIAIDLDLTAMGAIESYEGWALFAENSRYFAGTPSFHLTYGLNVTELRNDLSKCVSQEEECDLRKIQDDLLELLKQNFVVGADLLLAYTVCGLVLGAPTAGAEAALCPIEKSLLMTVVEQVKLDDKIVLDWLTDGVNCLLDLRCLKDRLCTLAEWIFQRAICASAGSDVALLLTDPRGQRIGGVLENGHLTVYRDVRGSWYSGSDSDPQYVVIPNPEVGRYMFTVTAKQPGNFQLTACNIVGGSVVATQHYSQIIGQSESQELSADLVSGGTMENLKVTPWWARYQPWLPYGMLAVVVLAPVAAYVIRRRERPSRQAGPPLKELRPMVDKLPVEPIQEDDGKPRVLRIDEE